ncbi:GNAT family N-acetyltransferase [Massilia sp.]|uniref:GNAT family N-acetyltransferase n=1 Tax=Massilia sp. TaxID=1882437 RepID=UPI002897C4D0|nr:GNAT family N-acetyltransferase [Massilia sp.]
MAQWRARGLGPWAIAARDDPARVIGFGGISLHTYLEQERVNLGYRFATSAWGRGYATELGHAALAFGFEDRRFNEIFGLVRPQHAASIRVLEKIGMARFATLDDVPGQAPSLVYRAMRRG